ncbi:MAG TPA: hypothetical protein VFH43_01815 [Candidatus Kapabacteria bacterium]|nr:hypothetical protein [Candidatus Kapabacteria bacterium]
MYDDAGHQLLLQFMGPTEGVVTFPPGPSTTIGMGLTSFQTLYWNGTSWVPSSNLLNDDTNITLTGQLISLVPDGLPAFILSSQTVIPNLNADMFDGLHAEDFVQDSLAINTTPPLTGGGLLVNDLTLGLAYNGTLVLSEGALGVNLLNSNS